MKSIGLFSIPDDEWLKEKRRLGLIEMEKTKPPSKMATHANNERLLPTKNQDTKIPIERILPSTEKITNKDWAEHWVNIVLMSKMWKAVIKMVKQK